MKRLLFILFTTLSMYVYGQNGRVFLMETDFKVSPDDSKIAFTLLRGGTYSVYEIMLFDTMSYATKISPVDNKNIYVNPHYSLDGKYIVFIKQAIAKKLTKSSYTDIVLFDRADYSCKILSDSKHYITNAVFSPDNQKIIFAQAGFVGHYSPVAKNAPHDIDIYSMNIDGTEKIKHTNFKAYSLNHILPSGSNFLSNIYAPREEIAGLYNYSLDTNNYHEVVIDTVKNKGYQYVPHPVVTRDSSTIIFSMKNKIYSKNLQDDTIELLREDPPNFTLCSMDFLHTQDKLLFARVNTDPTLSTHEDFQVFLLDINTKEVEKVRLKFEPQ